MEAYGNSKIIVNQVKGEYKVRNEDLIPYNRTTITWTEKCKGFYINHISQKNNMHADVLTTLTTTLAL